MNEQKLISLRNKHLKEVSRLKFLYCIKDTDIEVLYESHLKGSVCCKSYLDFNTGSNELLVVKSYYEVVNSQTFVIHEITRDLPF